MFAAERSIVVGMSCSFASTKTGARRAIRRTPSGPDAHASSSPTLRIPTWGASKAASSSARSRSDTSSATISGLPGRGITRDPRARGVGP